MIVKSKRARKKWYGRIERTNDPVFALAILTCAERWASLMESYLAAGTSMPVAAESIHRAATSGHPSLALHSALCDSMVDFLDECWAYGGELRKWYGPPMP